MCEPSVHTSEVHAAPDAANNEPPASYEEELARSRRSPPFSIDPARDDDDELFVVQLPTRLPAALARRPRPRSESEAEGAKDAPPPPPPPTDEVARLRPGKVGTLQLLESGDVRLVLGGETFDVDRGLRSTMAQQICAVDAPGGQVTVLGDVGKKLVVTVRPDLDDWFKRFNVDVPARAPDAEPRE